MKVEHVEILIKHRLKQAKDAVNDARILLDHQGSPQSVVNRSYFGMFYAALALLQKLVPPSTLESSAPLGIGTFVKY